jgi:sodium-dependent dicarboxylate transporter 2/3/5
MKNWKLWFGIVLPLAILAMPTALIPLAGITTTEHRLLAIFVFAVCFWVLEPIPVFATSVLIILAELLLISDKGLSFLRAVPEGGEEAFGTLVSYKALLGTFSSPIIMLFMGGFFLAMAATKYRLDTNLARVLLRPFGTNPKMVMLGLMGITALFSMFMSNTATTAMMLAVLVPVLKELDTSDRGRIGFVLAIPFAANIGGIGTPIGTPPNAVAQKYLTGDIALGFGEWMAFATPYVVVMLIISWLVLCAVFKITTKEVKITIKGSWLKTREAIIVYITFAVTLLLWLIGGKVHGMSSHSWPPASSNHLTSRPSAGMCCGWWLVVSPWAWAWAQPV